jgi:PAS domain S-box-containing protein
MNINTGRRLSFGFNSLPQIFQVFKINGMVKFKRRYILLSGMILLSGIMFISVYHTVKNQTITEFNTQQMLLAKQAAKSIEKYFHYYFLDLSFFSEISYISCLNRQGEELLDTFYKKHSDEILAVTRVSADGHILYTAPFNEKAIGADISNQKHIQTIIKTQKPVVSDVFEAVQGYPTVAYHVPVFNNGKFNGSLCVLIPFKNLAEAFLKNIKTGENGYAWVISEEGVELYCPVPGHIGKSIFETFGKFPSVISMAKKMIQGNQGITTYSYNKRRSEHIEEVTKHAVYFPIQLDNTFWSIVVSTPEKEVLSTMIGFRNRLIMIIALLMAVAAFLSYYVLQTRTLLKEEKNRRLTEKALLESEKKYRTILDEIEDGYFEVDIKGNLTFFNDSLCKIVDYSRSELMKMNNRDFMDAENSKKVYQAFNAVFTTGIASKGIDWELIQKDGTRRQLDTSVSLIKDADGKKCGFRGIVRDISDRKLTEEKMREIKGRYQALFDRSLDCVFIHDFKGNFIDGNEAALKMMGYTQKELSSLKISKIISRDQFSIAARVRRELEKTGKQKGVSIFRLKHKDGHSVDVETKSSVIFRQGKPYAIQGIARDITGKKKMESQLRQAQKMEAIGTLAGGIAHDFNNILSAILGYSEIALINLPENDPAHSNIEQVVKAGIRARDLVKQILTFSRQAEQDLKPLKIQPVIKEAIQLLRASIPATIEIRQIISPDCGSIMADPTQIHQIIMNLCTNAYHAMRESGGIIDISLSQVRLSPDKLSRKTDLPAGSYVKIGISDTGSGMDDLTLQRIFDPYFTTKPKGEGTGMGLAVVHGIIKSYGGDILVYSELGKGSSFQIYLPTVDDESMQNLIEHNASLPGGHESIMVLDDEPVIIEITRSILEDLGYRISPFTSSEKALNAFRAHPTDYDMVITDMSMPKMNGIQLSKEILSARPGLPIIICTGYNDLLNEETVKTLGIRKLILKPILRRTLALAVREVLDDNQPYHKNC